MALIEMTGVSQELRRLNAGTGRPPPPVWPEVRQWRAFSDSTSTGPHRIRNKSIMGALGHRRLFAYETRKSSTEGVI